MEPISATLAIISMGSAVAGMFNSAASRSNIQQGGYYSQLGAKIQADAQAAADEANARTSLKTAANIEEQARYASDAQWKEGERALGSNAVGYGSSGVTQDSGSAQDVLAESIRNITNDNYLIKHNAQVQADAYRQQAAQQQQAAANARLSGMLGIMSAGNNTAAMLSQNTGSLISDIGQTGQFAYNFYNRK